MAVIDRPYTIFHGGCTDGFAAAWLVHKKYPTADFYPGVYQKDPPWEALADRDVLFVDFSYKYDVMRQVCEKADSVTVYDHHASAQKDLEALQSQPNYHAVFDMNRCGATITWGELYPNQEPLTFLKYVEDQDLWRKVLRQTDEFSRGLRSYPQDFQTWDSLFTFPDSDFRTFSGTETLRISEVDVKELIEEGIPIQRAYNEQKVRIKEQVYAATMDGHSCHIVNAPYFFASEVANEIIGDAEFGACYYERADGQYQYSLRSEGDFDVSALAVLFGGGGHKNAAGFSVSKFAHTRTVK